MKREEFIEKVNNGENYLALWMVEDEFGKEVKKVKSAQDIDYHRWYDIATDVYECEDGFVGVKGAYNSKSEAQDWSDIGVYCEAFPMKATIKQTTIYTEE